MDFLNQKINAAFPAQFFNVESIQNLTEKYGEMAQDAAEQVLTIFTRQDTSDPNSRRAASPKNECPELLSNGKLLVMGIYPTEKIFSAVLKGEILDVDIVSDENLKDYLEKYRIPTPERV